jgi:LemA protein
MYRIGMALALVGIGLTLSACGYNTIPTLEEQAKARCPGPWPRGPHS